MTIWKNEDVIKWAQEYANKGVTLRDMENRLNVSHSTIWWCFQHRLSSLDSNLYNQALENLSYNKKKNKRKKEK